MSYLVLARKYRPQSFEDLVGQSHVARTLANAIAQNRVAHAFLFTGVRGVGKTTSARLLAKCLNCLGADGKATGPTATPCQVCAACKEIAAGNDMDVQEIDGASYNGVDEVRRLQEGLAFRPARDRFKIYIVDEVHMLSNAAWNAFLKTLEEPPPHVKFIFATTEVHKVPVTILSRCQRYDFKLIGTQPIASRLKEVLGLEKIAAEDAAVMTLAREAAGSMRDAMSLLDQVIAFSGDKLTAEDVTRVLGVADRAILHELAGALVGADAAAALRVVDRLAQQGFDLVHVARDVLRHLRNLVVAKVCGEEGRELLDLADEELRDVTELASKADGDDLTRLYQGFSRSFDEIARSGQPRAALEMTLVRLARRPPLLPLDELLVRLGDLEKRLGGGGAAPNPSRGGGGGGGRAVGSNASITSNVISPSWPSEASPDRTRGALALAQEPVELHVAPPPAPRILPRPTPVAPEESPPPPPVSATMLAAPAVAAPTRSTPSQPPPSQAPASSLDAPARARIEEWRKILDRLRRDGRTPLVAVLENAVPLVVTKERVVIAYEAKSFLGAQAADAEAVGHLTGAVRAHFGVATEVALDLSLRDTTSPTIASLDAEKRLADLALARQEIEKHPLVQSAIAIFGAELREVKLPDED